MNKDDECDQKKKRVPFVDEYVPLDDVRFGTRTKMIKNIEYSQLIRIFLHICTFRLLQSNHLILIWIDGVETYTQKKRKKEKKKKTQHRALSLSMIT